MSGKKIALAALIAAVGGLALLRWFSYRQDVEFDTPPPKQATNESPKQEASLPQENGPTSTAKLAEANPQPPAPTTPVAVAAVPNAAPITDPNVSMAPADVAMRENESQATLRMYMAHASLRTKEVSDPDSDANRKILETMVLKGLKAENNE